MQVCLEGSCENDNDRLKKNHSVRNEKWGWRPVSDPDMSLTIYYWKHWKFEIKHAGRTNQHKQRRDPVLPDLKKEIQNVCLDTIIYFITTKQLGPNLCSSVTAT